MIYRGREDITPLENRRKRKKENPFITLSPHGANIEKIMIEGTGLETEMTPKW